MALEIQTGKRWYNWHVGQDPLFHNAMISEIKEISADGDELEKIRAEITGIPMSTKRVVTWYGDDARFIVANLNY